VKKFSLSAVLACAIALSGCGGRSNALPPRSAAGAPAGTASHRSMPAALNAQQAARLVEAGGDAEVAAIATGLRLETGATGDAQSTSVVMYSDVTRKKIANRAALRRIVSAGRQAVDVSRKPQVHTPSANPGTGPYRRLETHPKNYYGDTTATYEIGYVAPTCDGNFVAGDGAYIYMGGWGSFAPGTYANVDAGLQFNKSPSHGSDWGLVLRVEGAPNNGYSPSGAGYMNLDPNTGYYQGAPKISFNCGNYTLRLSYSVQQLNANYPGQMGIIVTANDGHTAVNYVWITTNGTGGWSPTCQYCVLKQATSIATPTGQEATALYNNDEFSTTWLLVRVSCGFSFACGNPNADEAWGPYQTGNCTAYPTWGNIPYDPTTRDCRNSPTNTVNVVNVFNFTYDGESVLIKNWPTPAPAAGGGTAACSGGGRRQVMGSTRAASGTSGGATRGILSVRCISGGAASDDASAACDPSTQNCNPSACDPSNSSMWCYMPPPCDSFGSGCGGASYACDTTDPNAPCYEPPPCDPNDPSSSCYVPPPDTCATDPSLCDPCGPRIHCIMSVQRQATNARRRPSAPPTAAPQRSATPL